MQSGTNQSAVQAALTEALALLNAQRYGEARQRCDVVLRVDPRHPDALHILGMIAFRTGDTPGAVKVLNRALKVQPKLVEAWINLAHVHGAANDRRERAAALTRALALMPGQAALMVDIGKCYEKMGRRDEAASWCEKALAAKPDLIEAHIDLGISRMHLGDLASAEQHLTTALQLQTDHPLALLNLAIVRDMQGRMDDVLPLLDRGAGANPDHIDTHFQRALARLARGRLAEGWDEHIWRFRRTPVQTDHARFPYPYWRGEPLAGKHLLVWTEQGPGDEILLATMLPEVMAQAAHVTLACSPRMRSLFARTFPQATVTTMDGVAATTSLPQVQASLSDLGRWRRPDMEFFTSPAGFLKADPGLTAEIRARYAAKAAGKRLIGIAWRSANISASREKSTDLREWRDILQTPGVQFVSLQYGDVKADLGRVRSALDVNILHDGAIDGLRDMDGFAAQVDAMDHVIAVSNTTVHVAGGLGKPVWTMVPASYGRIWYWFLDRADSPWYPSMRLYRQERGQGWSLTLAQVAADLRTEVAP